MSISAGADRHTCIHRSHINFNEKESTMAYIDGFVIAVPTANKQKFIDLANTVDAVFVELGATRVLECWGDDVPEGKLTDFRRAVQATPEETVVFSWIEWPDKATRDAAMPKVMADPRMKPGAEPMAFDGKRMIFGGFAPVVELGGRSTKP
jgi:uncharacterized protein YbaA (DUF1428 family)